LGVGIIAASVDTEKETQEVAAELGYPVAWGVSRETANRIGAWWDEERNHIQPSEFFMTGQGKVLASTYSSSPLGRMDPEDALTMAKFVIDKSK